MDIAEVRFDEESDRARARSDGLIESPAFAEGAFGISVSATARALFRRNRQESDRFRAGEISGEVS